MSEPGSVGAAMGAKDQAPDSVRFHAGFCPPPGSVDTHVHVFDPVRFPFAAAVPYRPAAAECGTAEELAMLLDAHSIAGVVLVNPTSGYGDDNRCMLAALEILGARARGIARVPLRTSMQTLRDLARRGVVGVRLDFVQHGLGLLDDPELKGFLGRLVDAELCLDVQGEGDQLASIMPCITALPLRCVVDHFGRPDPAAGVEAPGFRALLVSAASGRVAVKLSGSVRSSRLRAPFADLAPFTDRLLEFFSPAALMWGSDWPFLRCPMRLDYGSLLGVFARQVPHPKDRVAVLSTTPRRWFGFE